MEAETSILAYVISYLPLLVYLVAQLWVSIWLTFKLIRVQQQMVRAQEGILAKLTDMESRLAAKPSRD